MYVGISSHEKEKKHLVMYWSDIGGKFEMKTLRFIAQKLSDDSLKKQVKKRRILLQFFMFCFFFFVL